MRRSICRNTAIGSRLVLEGIMLCFMEIIFAFFEQSRPMSHWHYSRPWVADATLLLVNFPVEHHDGVTLPNMKE
ncbi:hypothetical protein K439DRAFT_201301 [Ramaria rubella]|nr:hypothetical protein K439DRAFT_201301 [Ramaria rubella]